MSSLSLDYMGNYNRLDAEGMYEQIVSLPEQIKTTYNQPESEVAQYYKNINKVVICGMGGSAIAGDITKSLFEKKIPIWVVKDYCIPDFVDDATLGIVCSYSGNTEETVACFEALQRQGAQIAIVTSGGILRHYADEGYLMKLIPTGYQPRAAIGYLFFSIVKILEELNLIENQNTTVKLVLLNIQNKLNLIKREVELSENLAKQIATRLYKKIPVIYSFSPQFYPVAYRFKSQFNENAKNHAFCHTFSEMNHNEIEGWETEHMNTLIPLFIQDFHEEDRYHKRVRTLQDIFKKQKIEFIEIYMDGKSLMGKMFTSILLGDMISYYLAILNKVNPSEINYITYLKKNI